MAIDTGGPAFPMSVSANNVGDGACQLDVRIPDGCYGMTLLDWFAGEALPMAWADEVASSSRRGIAIAFNEAAVAKNAYRMAAVMLAEKRRREQEQS